MSTGIAAPPVYSPCTKKWEFMHRAGLRSQFCDQCRLPVHNLSAMSKREAAEFLERAKTRRTCLTYVRRRDGSLVTRTVEDVWKWRWFRVIRSTLAGIRTSIVARWLAHAPLRAGERQGLV